MKLNEAIKHSEEVAKQNEEDAIIYSNCKKHKKNLYEIGLAENAEKKCCKCAGEHRQLAKWLKELKAHREAWEKCIKEIKEWYWNADKQAIAKDPCVVDAMVDLFIRTINEYRPKEGDAE